MKKILLYMAALLIAGSAITGCSDDREINHDGNLYLRTAYEGNVQVVSRADGNETPADDPYSEENLRKNTLIWISGAEGVVRKFNGVDDVPADGVRLVGGFYVAEAWAGDSLSADWNARYFKACQPFQIDGDEHVTLNLSLANVLVSVEFDEQIDNVLFDYKLTVGHSRGELTFDGRDSRVASFMMPSTDTDLTYKLEGKEIDGRAYTKTGTITAVRSAHQYILKFKHDGGTALVGGLFVGLKIEDVPLIQHDVMLMQSPTIVCPTEDIDRPIRLPRGAAEKMSLYIGSNGHFTAVELNGDIIRNMTGDSETVNLISAADNVIGKLKDGGIEIMQNEYNADKNLAYMKLAFQSSFLNSLEAGMYQINITVTDDGYTDDEPEENNTTQRTTRKTITIIITDEVISPLEPSDDQVEPDRARINAKRVKDDEVSDLKLEYRLAGTSEWSSVAPLAEAADGYDYTFEITGLQPLSRYEYRTSWVRNGETETSETKSGDAALLTMTNKVYGGDFEEWTGSSPLLFGNREFWDSGNHGSSTMNKNVTTNDSSVKHSGNYSAKLSSQFVGLGGFAGKFAAGNAFVGYYLKTDGTDGILGWGKPFTYHPKGLKGWVKYNPAKVEYTASGAPDIVNGELDKGIIYVALLNDDKSVQGDSSYPDYPVVVRTKGAHLFKKDESNVISYGELVFNEATAGSGMVEFSINLESNPNVDPSNTKVAYLVIVCSASKGGDYFAGGASTMWIDDFEFIY